jgi:peptidase A4-like protein
MQPPGRSRLRKSAPWLFRGAIAVAVLALIVSTQLSASRRNAKIAAPGAVIVAPITGFGGYNWYGKVSNISAQWRVPAISSSSKAGYASTWIGVQNELNNQFVQIGVTENYYGDGPVQYQAFWSDLAEGFSPQNFGDVSPGDLVSVSMTRSNRGWALDFVDKSRHLNGKRFVKLSESVPFTQGEWIQEDPSPSTNTAQDLPYPTIANVAFQGLRVNGAAPKLNTSDGQVLIASDGTIRVPSAFRDDSFGLTAPTGAAAQYLSDEQSLDAALSEFNLQLTSFNSASVSKESAVASSLSDALKADVKSLSTQSWPAPSRVAVRRLVQNDRNQLSDLKSWEEDDYNTQGLAFTQFQQQFNRSSNLVDDLRITLGLPPL